MKKINLKGVILSVLFFASSLLFIESIFSFLHTYHLQEDNIKLVKVANETIVDIQNEISYAISATTKLEQTLIANDYNTTSFDTYIKPIAKMFENISGLQYAKDGIVSNVYPYDEHKEAIGHDLLKDKRRVEGAIKAIRDKKLTFVGPIRLIQNGKYAIIARKPIFETNGDFWGFATVLIYIDDLLKNIEPKILKNNFTYQLAGYNPDSKSAPIFKQSGFLYKEYTQKFDIVVPNGMWHLYMSPQEIECSTLYIKYILFFISFVISIFVYRRFR